MTAARGGDGPVAVGAVKAAYGVAGAVWVLPLSDAPGRAGTLREVILTKPGEPDRPMTVARARAVEGRWLVEFEGVTTREAAQALGGWTLAVAAADRAPLPPGRFWVSDLVGRAVVTEDGEALGLLTGVIPRAGNDLFVIAHPKGELLFPALRDLVREVPAAGGAIRVRVPPGLLEACLTPHPR